MPNPADRQVRIGAIAAEFGLSEGRIRQLADSGVIPTTRTPGGHRLFKPADVRMALARRAITEAGDDADPGRPSWRHELSLLGLAEDVVWRRLAEDLQLDKDSNAYPIMQYAFTEMLNNAIEHSQGETAVVTWWTRQGQWSFEIVDDGVGVYQKVMRDMRLGSEFEAVQELSKGKRTSAPSNHTGEGVFFTSRAVDLFRLGSGALRWTVDNLRDDVALGSVAGVKGTTVLCRIDQDTDRVLRDVFLEYTSDHAFIRTRPAVKLFEIGTVFVSRSEARRLLDGLAADFEVVEVDFRGVTDVGQAFVDELFRVWPAAHPGKSVVPVNMNQAVRFMVERGLPRDRDA